MDNVTDLEKLSNGKYRVTYEDGFSAAGSSEEDKVWCRQIKGKHGLVYPYGKDGSLTAYTESNRFRNRLLKAGLELQLKFQDGANLKFYPDKFQLVADTLKLKKKRTVKMTDEYKAKLLERVKKMQEARRAKRLSEENKTAQDNSIQP